MSAPAVNGDGVIADPLTDAEYDDLERLETVVSKGLDTFVEVGNALAEIRDRRLYRQYFPSFAVYCEQQWDMGKSQAYRLIDAAEIVTELEASPIGDVPLPATESQARELGKVPAEDRPAVMAEAAATGKPTAAGIAAAAAARAPKDDDPEREMDARQKKAADDAHNLADRLSRYEVVHERTIRLMEARCKRWRNQ